MVAAKPDFKVGDRVKHDKFGEADILDLYPIGEDTCAVVSFEKLGQKKVVLRYAKLKPVSQQEAEPEGGEAES